MTKPNEITVT